MQTQQVPIQHILAGDNDRQHFDANGLQELADSIRENGLAQPPTLRPYKNGYQIVCGERRVRAVRDILKWPTITAYVRKLTDEEASAIMLAENTGRRDLNPIEEAQGFQKRLDQFNWPIQKLANIAGRSNDYVRKRLHLLRLVPELQKLVEFGYFPIGHALAMRDLDNNRQRIALRKYRESKSMPLKTFQEHINILLRDQQQSSMWDMSTLLLEHPTESIPNLRWGRQCRLNIPVDTTLPPVRVRYNDSIGDILTRYLEDLQAAGNEQGVSVIANLLATLVCHKWAIVPATPTFSPNKTTPTLENLVHEEKIPS